MTVPVKGLADEDILTSPASSSDTEIHFPGMEIDSAIRFVLYGVEFHQASSFGLKCYVWQRHSIMPQAEALNSIKAESADAKSRAAA